MERSCNLTKWARNVQKHTRVKGLKYKIRREKVMPAKISVDIIYRQKCNKKITSDKREEGNAMAAFYNLKSQFEQSNVIRGCTEIKEIKRRCLQDNSKRPRSEKLVYILFSKK